MAVQPIPGGRHTVTPYLICKGAGDAIEFYKKAFNAVEIDRLTAPDGQIGHAEIQIGNSIIMMADEHPGMGYFSPLKYGGTSVSILLYVEDVDALFQQAIAAGGKESRPVKTEFYGDRAGTLTDPFGHVWTIATHVEDLSWDEIKQRMEAMIKEMK